MVARSCRVLVVDDDERMLRLVEQSLKGRTAHAVQVAHGARAARARLSRDPFDVLIAGIDAPDRETLRLAREARDANPRLRVLLMGADEGDLRSGGRDAHGTLAKPFTTRGLAREIVRVIAATQERALTAP